MDRKPSIKRIVMFKHGVAYLERSGPASGSFELRFRKGEMNDVLKSLAVWVAEGDAKLRSLGFDAPEDPDVALAERGLLLGFGSALDAMLVSLRGRTVEVDLGAAPQRGEVLGVQESPGAHGEKRRSLLMRSAADVVSVIDLQVVRSVRLVEEVSRDRLDFMVSRSQAATSGETRAVRVALDGPAADLRVAYVIPAPVWRVSYRIVREGEHAMVMAMGIVHNPADEDLDGVELTLTTGQPVSFVIDLYHPKNVKRAVVEEQARAAAPPVRYQGGAPRAAAVIRTADEMDPEAFDGAPMPGSIPQPAAMSLSAAMGAAGEGAAAGVDRGEFFEYRVASPLSIGRGGSAMVPIAATRVPARRERIWREGTGPNPDIVLSFANETGLVLEEGPAVIYDEGVYAGESMLPYSARGVGVKMGFAKDLSLRVSMGTTHETIATGVRFEKVGAIEEQRQEIHRTIEAHNDHGEEVELVVELPKVHGRTLSPGSAEVLEETGEHRRFAMKIGPHAKGSIRVSDRWASQRRIALDSLAAAELERWSRDRFLDDAAFAGLAGVIRHRLRVRDLRDQKKQADADQAKAYAKQTKLSEQLNVLKETGPEGTLRLRYVKELETEQDRVNACEKEAARIEQEIAAEERALAAEISRLTAA